MNKNLIIPVLSTLMVFSGLNTCYAEIQPVSNTDNTAAQTIETKELLPPVKDNLPGPCPEQYKKPCPPSCDKPCPPDCTIKGPHHHKHFRGPHPSKAEMEAKKLEFEKRLNLSEAQKQQIEIQKKADREKIKPVIDQIKLKKQEYKAVQADSTLSQAEKNKKLTSIKKEMKELKFKAEKLRKQNMESFESVLTDQQKKEFSQIKKEQKQKMEERRKQFEERKKNKPQGCPIEKLNK